MDEGNEDMQVATVRGSRGYIEEADLLYRPLKEKAKKKNLCCQYVYLYLTNCQTYKYTFK